jgi:tyrosine decarboxylase
MDHEQFRRDAHALVDFVVDYYKRVGELPVRAQVAPGYLRQRLPAAAPERPEPFEAILADVRQHIVPGVTHWQSPSFFAYFPANSSYPAMLGDVLSATFNAIGFSWVTSPALTELEALVLDWLAALAGLPPRFFSSGAGGGVIQGTASEATLVALLAARTRALRGAASSTPAAAAPPSPEQSALVGYASDQAHFSVKKAFAVAGLQPQQLRLLPTRRAEGYALQAAELERAISADKAAGRVPFFLVATVGTTSSCAVDPLHELLPVAQRHALWSHVDAAYAGSAWICPEHRWSARGVESADSVNFNAHKWLLTNFDLSAMWVASRSALIDALGGTPEYLRNRESERGAVIDYKDWQIPLGRRFRALKLWLVLRSFGAERLREHIRGHVELAQRLARKIAADPRFEMPVPQQLSLVCFRLRAPPGGGVDANALNRRLLDAVNETGRAFITHTELDGQVVLRVAIGSPQTRQVHVDALWQLVCDKATALLQHAA